MIKLQLLGGLAVQNPDAPLDAAPRRRALALLAVVAAAAPQPIAREKLVALLWPESDDTRARNSLRQTVFALRRDLHNELFLPESSAGLQLDPAHIDVDLCRFRDALSRGAPEEAVAAYGGAFLDGFHVPGSATFSQWVEAERERVQRQYIEALVALAQCAEREGRFDDAVAWRQRHAAADPLSSRAALSLLKALTAAGDRAGALRYAARHERLMREELEIESDAVVAEFVATLRREAQLDGLRFTPPDQPAVPPSRAAAEPASRQAPASGHPAEPPALPRRVWLATAAVAILVVTLTAGRWLGIASAATDWPMVVTVASGAHPVSGRDPANRLIACRGRACPSGSLPQDAYVVAANAAYAAPLSGTSYIAPVPNAATIAPPGFRCCTTAEFESTFRLPPDATEATITVSMLADNQATVAINGAAFGRQRDSLASTNYTDGDRLTTTFAPDPSGINRLRVTLWDGGGALGLQYLATVTYRRAAEARDDRENGAADRRQGK